MNINLLIGYSLMATSMVLTIFYVVKIITTKNPKGRYEWINNNEIKIVRLAAYGGIIGIEFVFVLASSMAVTAQTISRFFLAFGSAAICLVSFHYFFKVYYPKIVEKRLKVLRYTPRISPKTGALMVLLHESEEDTYLDDSMIMEEDIHSIDYDVWVDKASGYVQIEKYLGYKHALECSECGYQTLFIQKEVIVKNPTLEQPGLLVKHLKCKYCSYRVHREVVLKKAAALEAAFANV
jgi:hypothetical protein